MRERPLLVTGAAGAVGRAVMALARETPTVGLTHAELDICDADAVDAAIELVRPRVVVNAAAYTAVDEAERNPTRAYLVNAAGPSNLARACATRGVWLLHLSSDCVFGEGTSGRSHAEDDSPAPLNEYGRSKYLGERNVSSTLPTHLILRTSWLFGRDLRGFVSAVARSLRHEGRAEVVTGQMGCPTPVEALADAIHLCAARVTAGGLAPGIYHFCSAVPVTRIELSEWIANWLSQQTGQPRGVIVPIDPRDSDVAPRALNAAMSMEKLSRATGLSAPSWQPAMAEVLQQMLSLPSQTSAARS